MRLRSRRRSPASRRLPRPSPREARAIARAGSLRDFDLKTRLFRYPLSYMIYSAAFDNLPDKARDLVYQRLHARLQAEKRDDVIEIVRETKSNLPAYWRQ